MAKITRASPCVVCKHSERARIELLRARGVSLDKLSKQFSVQRDAVWRHWGRHVSDETKAYLIGGPAKLDELATRAAAEGLSVLDYLGITRSMLMTMFQQAAQRGEGNQVSLISGRLLQCLRTIAEVSGDLGKFATNAGVNITNNTLVMSSPALAGLQATILKALRPYPEAYAAVIVALREAEPEPPAPQPLMLEAQAEEVSHA